MSPRGRSSIIWESEMGEASALEIASQALYEEGWVFFEHTE